MTTQLQINIIGAGKVGRVLAQLFNQFGVFQVQDVVCQSLKSAQTACQFIGSGRPVANLDAIKHADIYLLSVPDDQIAALCLQLQQRVLMSDQSVVFHCSGALSSSEISLIKNPHRGVTIQAASVHPCRSFANPEQVAASFKNTLCTIEGNPRAVALLSAAFTQIGAQMVAIAPEAKTLYHAAAVFASNYLVTLMDTALSTFQAAGIDRETAQKLAQPLAQETLNNVFTIGTKRALTGPIARGDEQTVQKHQTALDNLPANFDQIHSTLYAALGTATRKLKARE